MAAPSPRPVDLLLVTCARLPGGEPGHQALDRALAEAGIGSAWVAWDDQTVDWSGPLVAVRSAWDYESRREEFLRWAQGVPRLLNGVGTFAWNTDKAYLLDLADAGVPVVPTRIADGEEELPEAVAWAGVAVVKPRVGAGGRGLVVFDGTDGGPEGLDESELGPGPWVVQPLMESVRTEGEWSVFVLDGEVVSAVRKHPAAGDIRVNEEYGGRVRPERPSPAAADLARTAVTAASRILGRMPDYARVDLLAAEPGRPEDLLVGELELTEPGLYLDRLPANADHFTALVRGRLAEPDRS